MSTFGIYLKEWGAYSRGVPVLLYFRPPSSRRKNEGVSKAVVKASPSAEILAPNRSSSTSWRPSGRAAGEDTEIRGPLAPHVVGLTLMPTNGGKPLHYKDYLDYADMHRNII